MNQIDTRPQQVASVLAYRENSLPLITNVNQEDDISGAEISVELQNSSGKMLYVVTTFTVLGQIILVNFTRQQVKEMPAIAHCVIIINGVYSYGFKITPQTGFGIPQNNQVDLTINLKGDKGDPGDLTAEAQELKDLMTEDREATAADRLQTGQDRAAVDADAQAVETGRAATEGYRDEVIELKEETEVFKDQALATLPQRVATFAAMIALIQAGHAKAFTVINDEYQSSLPPNIAEHNVPYLWDGFILYEYNSSPCDFQTTL